MKFITHVRLIFIIIFVTIFSSFGLVMGQTDAPSDNLIIDSGFENDNLGVWNWSSSAEATGALDSTEFHEGKQSFKMSNKSDFRPNIYGSLRQRVMGLKPKGKYLITMWIKGQALTARDDSVHRWTNCWYGGGVGWKWKQILPEGTFTWRQVSQTVVMDPEETSFELVIVTEGPTESLWIDDVEFKEIE